MWGYHDKNVVLNKGEIFYTMEHMAGFHVRNTSLSSRDHSMGPTWRFETGSGLPFQVHPGVKRWQCCERSHGELIGGIVLLLSPLTNQAYCRGTLTARQGATLKIRQISSKRPQRRALFWHFSTPLAQLEPADLTPVQIALAALYLRSAT